MPAGAADSKVVTRNSVRAFWQNSCYCERRVKNALRQYSKPDQENTGVDEKQAIAVLMEKYEYEIVRAMFRPDMPSGFDYRRATVREATPQERLGILAGAIDWILTMQQEDAAREKTDEGKKRAHRRYSDAVLALSKAYALAAASDEAKEIREEVGFFQAVHAAMVKSTPNGGRSTADRELAIQQIVSRAVVSTEIVDIMKAAGIQTPKGRSLTALPNTKILLDARVGLDTPSAEPPTS